MTQKRQMRCNIFAALLSILKLMLNNSKYDQYNLSLAFLNHTTLKVKIGASNIRAIPWPFAATAVIMASIYNKQHHTIKLLSFKNNGLHSATYY